MDLVLALKKKIDALPDGEYVAGLRAVLRHVEVAFSHLQRGQDVPEDSAFTDAIYRSNQAFEGGVKEAYRVLAKKPPEKITPSDIEKYLQDKAVFRPRVLALFTNYRREWRNPSTHDYKLDFDEGEALLACVSVTAFACLVTDQIAEDLAYQRAAQTTLRRRRRRLSPTVTKDGVVTTLGEKVAEALFQFTQTSAGMEVAKAVSESQTVGSVAGFLSALVPKDSVTVDAALDPSRSERADILISTSDESILIEIKQHRTPASAMASALAQVEQYLMLASATSAVLYFVGLSPPEYEITTHEVPNSDKLVYVIGPKAA